MSERIYYAKRIVQWDGAPPLYVMSLAPEDLLSWADVPRKAPKAMAGYQRPLDEKRAEKIAEFMQKNVNHIVPGTIIVASDEGFGNEDSFFNIEEVTIEEVDAQDHDLFKITFDYEYDCHPDDIDTDILRTMLDEIIEKYESRLTEEELTMLQEGDEIPIIEEEANPENEEEANPENEEEANLTKPSGYTKFIKALYKLRDDELLHPLDEGEEIVEAGVTGEEGDVDSIEPFLPSDVDIAQAEADAAQARADEAAAAEEEERLAAALKDAVEWKKWIISEHKVGNIMDGQHRVWGAKEMNPDACAHLDDDDRPSISVTLVPDLAKAEQVFHFSMMNMTPVRVKAGLARSSAIHSLTKTELDEYDERLGNFIDVTQARWINELYQSDNSPFQGMLTWDFLDDSDEEFVDEKIMVQIAARWYNRDAKDKDFGILFSNAPAWNNDTTYMEFRLRAFFVFWKKVAEKFPDDWENKESNIWKKVSLWVLQDWIRVRMTGPFYELWVQSHPPPFDNLDSLGEMTEHLLTGIPFDFFAQSWNHVDDTGQGKQLLFEEMDKQYSKPRVSKKTWLYRGA